MEAREYPVFPHVPYAIALASALVKLSREHGIDVLHAHYAVPHATSAWMAREVLGGGVSVVTTLHGTDITLVGVDESYLPITRHSIRKSDAVTAPSVYLQRETWSAFDLPPPEVPIEVVPNFVDPDVWRPRVGNERPHLAAWFGAAAQKVPVITHVSNFRPVKRLDRVVDTFARVLEETPARLLLVGDGPERAAAEARVAAHGIADRVAFTGDVVDVVGLLRESALLLLPSDSESFGLAALEALACGVPVVATRVGGLPEVVRHDETGLLVPPGDDDALLEAVLDLALDPERRRAFGEAGREDAIERFSPGPAVDRYEEIYRRIREP